MNKGIHVQFNTLAYNNMHLLGLQSQNNKLKLYCDLKENLAIAIATIPPIYNHLLLQTSYMITVTPLIIS